MVDSQACAKQGAYCLSWDESSFGRAGAFEEYRYDALGRRILVRRRYDAECQYTCHASMERFVWDGEQILVEIRVPGSDGSSLESDYDVGQQYGRTAYVHGPGIDQPASVTRMGWSNSSGPLTFLPHRNWRGHHSRASYADGTIDNGSLNLYDIPWPGDGFGATLNAPPESGDPPWLGSLLVEKTDASGQMYMRNRYYDPQSGRFTQEDPIGLAGGLNLYGFGGGDAVNFSDPHGLSAQGGVAGDTLPPYQPIELDRMVVTGARPLGDQWMEARYLETLNVDWYLAFRRRAEEIRTRGHEHFPGEENSHKRHFCASYVLALEAGGPRTRTVGAINEIQGFVRWDLMRLPSRIRGDTPWAFQWSDLMSNEGGIQAAEQGEQLEECLVLR